MREHKNCRISAAVRLWAAFRMISGPHVLKMATGVAVPKRLMILPFIVTVALHFRILRRAI
jgi:hypothetical protein